MYLPRSLISHLYLHLQRTHHALSPPVLILVALEPDALCACRILTSLLRRDYIPHKIHPVAGYGDLARAGQELVKPMRAGEGGSGGVVACLGVGGLVDLEGVLGVGGEEGGEGGFDGVEIWVFDARRPWNLNNVFGGCAVKAAAGGLEGQLVGKEAGVDKGQISKRYRPGRGGIVVFDDGDIEAEMGTEKEAWYALEDMPDLEDDGEDLDESDAGSDAEGSAARDSLGRKRKSWSDREDGEDDESDKENERPHQRRRSNSSSSVPSTPSKYPNRRVTNLIHSTPPSNQESSPPPPRSPSPRSPSPRQLRRRLLRLRRKHNAVLTIYHTLGTSYSEPISSMLYSLASELGREDNDTLWLSIVGVSSSELSGHTPTGVSLTNHDLDTATSPVFKGWSGTRGSRIRAQLRDEVRRLNPPELTETGREIARGSATDVIPTHARSPTDTSIRLSPEPRFLLIRHWSLYDSMLHSPYLSAKLRVWTEPGRRRLHKLLAKMGVSLSQCKQSYTHMDMDLKRDLRQKLLHFAPMYGLDGLVPPPSSGRGGADTEGWGFVRSWGWKACLSAVDVGVVIGAILEAGAENTTAAGLARARNPDAVPTTQAAEALERFYTAYDAVLSPTQLMAHIPAAQTLHRAILRTGTTLLQKRQIRHLRAFRMAIVKEGPDVGLFVNPGALTKLALWVGRAVKECERDDEDDAAAGKMKRRRGGTPLVLGCVDEGRGVYVVVGLGGGGGGAESAVREKAKKEKDARREGREKERESKREAKRKEREERGEDDDEGTEEEDEESDASDSDDSDDEEDAASRTRGLGRNRFGSAFQEVVEETNARVRLDSFEHCVVEVRKEDLSGFLESLSMKAVVG